MDKNVKYGKLTGSILKKVEMKIANLSDQLKKSAAVSGWVTLRSQLLDEKVEYDKTGPILKSGLIKENEQSYWHKKIIIPN